jgi:hypothetical protein
MKSADAKGFDGCSRSGHKQRHSHAPQAGRDAASYWMDGGAERDRTAGLLVANEALSQLSYSPTQIDFYILPAFPSLRNSLSEG